MNNWDEVQNEDCLDKFGDSFPLPDKIENPNLYRIVPSPSLKEGGCYILKQIEAGSNYYYVGNIDVITPKIYDWGSYSFFNDEGEWEVLDEYSAINPDISIKKNEVGVNYFFYEKKPAQASAGGGGVLASQVSKKVKISDPYGKVAINKGNIEINKNNAENLITKNNIQDGNTLINFGKESEYKRYYKLNTFEGLPFQNGHKKHPLTRNNIPYSKKGNIRILTARIREKNAENNGVEEEEEVIIESNNNNNNNSPKRLTKKASKKPVKSKSIFKKPGGGSKKPGGGSGGRGSRGTKTRRNR